MIFSWRTKTSVGGCGGPDEKAGPLSLLKAEHKAGVAGKAASGPSQRKRKVRPCLKPTWPSGRRERRPIFVIEGSGNPGIDPSCASVIWLLLLCGPENHSAVSGLFGFIGFARVRPDLQARGGWWVGNPSPCICEKGSEKLVSVVSLPGLLSGTEHAFVFQGWSSVLRKGLPGALWGEM